MCLITSPSSSDCANYNDNGTMKYAINDSFPLVTGEEFDKQMEIWYNGGASMIAASIAPSLYFAHTSAEDHLGM